MTEPATGPLSIEGYRPGVYIRNVDAIVWAADLRDAIRDAKPLMSWMDRKRIEDLSELLESVKCVSS